MTLHNVHEVGTLIGSVVLCTAVTNNAVIGVVIGIMFAVALRNWK